MILYMIGYNVPIRWLGKDSLFRGPFGGVLCSLGGVPTDRSRSHHMVEQMVALLNDNERAVVLVAPEATRRRVEYWKSGFYHIAIGAKVPIALGYVDAGKHLCGIGPLIYPSGDIATDMGMIAEFYGPITGIRPQNQGPVRVKGE